jgi:hypothetical protein
LPVELPVSGDLHTSLLYVDDAAEYVARLATGSIESGVYLTGGYSLSIEELSEAVRSHFPEADISFNAEGATLNSEDAPVYLVDNSKIVSTTGHRAPELRARIADHAREALAADA